ncbi:MAG: hypothetical protein BIFFINMI_02270 [Phycisphaerae bacterium]|nr:hypothetical protein [Phycisphaerae bacterium]
MRNCMKAIGFLAVVLAVSCRPPAAFSAGPVAAGDPPGPTSRPDLEPNVWTEIAPKYMPPPGGGSHHPVSWNKLVYDSVGKRIINIDRWAAPGRIEGTYIYANSLMALDLGKNEIVRLSLFNWKKEASASGGYRTVEMPENKTEPTPLPRHPYGEVAFVPGENAVYLGAGANQTTSSDGKARHPNDTWRFDLAANKWEQVKGEQPPPSLSDCMTFVPDLNAIVRWVSSDEAAWFMDLKTRTWSKKPIADGPRLGLRTAMTYDTRRKQVLLYGGQVLGGPFAAPGPQLWALSVTDLKWKRLPDGPPASAPGWAYAPRHDVALCWRKVNPKTWDTGECWVYFPGEQKWLKIESPKPVPPKLYQNLTYDESRDAFVCHTRDAKWYVLRLVPAKLNGVPPEYVKRMEQEAAGRTGEFGGGAR